MIDQISGNLSRESIAASELMAELRGLDRVEASIAEAQLFEDEEIIHDVIEGETNLLEAIAAAVAEIDECEIIADGCKAKVAQIAARRARVEARAERIRAMIGGAMLVSELQTARLPTATVTLKKVPPKPVVIDESLIPSEFWKPQPPKLNKAGVIAAAKGFPISGVEMDNGSVSLQIRRS